MSRITQETLEERSRLIQVQRKIALDQYGAPFYRLSNWEQEGCERLARLQIREEDAAAEKVA